MIKETATTTTKMISRPPQQVHTRSLQSIRVQKIRTTQLLPAVLLVLILAVVLVVLLALFIPITSPIPLFRRLQLLRPSSATLLPSPTTQSTKATLTLQIIHPNISTHIITSPTSHLQTIFQIISQTMTLQAVTIPTLVLILRHPSLLALLPLLLPLPHLEAIIHPEFLLPPYQPPQPTALIHTTRHKLCSVLPPT